MPLRRLALPVSLLLCGCADDAAPAPEADPREQAAMADTPPPAPPGGPQASRTEGLEPGAYQLMQAYGIDAEEATMRLRAQERSAGLARTLRRNPPRGFSDIWIEHAPDYAIVLAFTDPPDRAAILARADPEIRRHIVFRSAVRDRAEIERDSDRIIAAMRGAPGQWAGGYEVKTGRFEYTATGPRTVAYAERHLPADLRDDVTFRVGAVPVPLAR